MNPSDHYFTDSTPIPLRYLFLFVFVVACSVSVLAQSVKIDSLRKRSRLQQGTEKIDALNTLAYELFSFDYSASKEIAKEALRLSTELKYDKGIAEAMIYDAVAELNLGHDSVSIPEFKRSLTICKNKPELKYTEGFGFTYLGLNYQNLNKLDSSQFYYDKAYLILRDSLKPYYLSFLYLNLASLNGLKNEPSLQLKYLQKCWRIREQMADKKYLVYVGERIAAFQNDHGNYDDALSYLDKVQQSMGGDTIDNEEISFINKQRGLIYVNQGKSIAALDLFSRSKAFFERNQSTLDLTNSFLDIGNALTQIGNYEISLKNYFSGLTIAEANHYEYERTQLLCRIGWVYFSIKQYSFSRDYAEKGLNAAKEYHHKLQEAYAMNLLGLLAKQQNKMESASGYLNKALAIREEVGDRVGVANTLFNLGSLYEETDNLNEAELQYQKSLGIAEKIQYSSGIASAYQVLGQLYLKMKRFQKARDYLVKAETVSKEIKAPGILVDIYKNKRDLFLAELNYKEANAYSLLYENLKDSLFTKNLSDRIFALQHDVQLDQQAKEIKILNQQNDLQRAKNLQQRIIIVVSLAMLLIACVVGYLIFTNYRKTKLYNREITEQKEEIQAQSEELTESNQIISSQNESLKKSHDEIIAQNEELIQSQEEISAQRDLVTEQNRKLDEARIIIEKQNEEIRQRNENLEEQVDKRTKELVEYNQQLEQFAFISSHNLRAPVARILGLGQLLELSGKSSQDEELIHKSLIATTRELDRVVRDLNTILEIKKNNTSVVTEIDLDEELKLIRINLEKEISETKAEVVTDFSLVNSVQSIRPYLDSILVNLISNAIKYRHPHRTPIIKLKTELVGSFIKLTVEDNGLGIDLALCGEKLFTLYSRFHNHVEGKGLGLYLVKTQVISMGGRIEVESELNKGLTFHIYLKADLKHRVVNEQYFG